MCTKAREGTAGRPALVSFIQASVSDATQPLQERARGRDREGETQSQTHETATTELGQAHECVARLACLPRMG